MLAHGFLWPHFWRGIFFRLCSGFPLSSWPSLNTVKFIPVRKSKKAGFLDKCCLLKFSSRHHTQTNVRKNFFWSEFRISRNACCKLFGQQEFAWNLHCPYCYCKKNPYYTVHAHVHCILCTGIIDSVVYLKQCYFDMHSDGLIEHARQIGQIPASASYTNCEISYDKKLLKHVFLIQ